VKVEENPVSRDSASSRLRVLTLSCVFPNPDEPTLGVFVKSRLEALAERASVRVLAPVPLLDYSRPVSEWLHAWNLPAEPADQPLKITHPRWFYPPLSGGLNPYFLYWRLKPKAGGIHKRQPFNLLDAHFAYPDGIAASLLARKLGIPFVVTLRGNETLHAGFPARRWLIQRALVSAGRVITVSERLRQFAISLGVAPEKTRTIPNGVNSGLFHPRDRDVVRAANGIGARERVILSAGTLIERKGHHRVIEALQQIAPDYPDVRLLIAGGRGREGNFASSIEDQIKRLGLEPRVTLLGRVDPEKMAELMAAADLFCLASSREGWPNVVHEAMACGTPVVATDIGGVPDMVPGEDHGIVIPANDQERLRDALAGALAKNWQREDIAQRAQSRSWSVVADEVYEEMTQVVAETRSGGR
jgi:glycosyltransferase involved in cell wall biosynthesis